MGRKPEGDNPMTGAERQARRRQLQREHDEKRQELLMSLALVVTAAGDELEATDMLKDRTKAKIMRLAREIRRSYSTVNPKVKDDGKRS